MKDVKLYSDTYLFNKYPLYEKRILQAVTQDPMIDKSTDEFQDVVYEVKRARVSDNLVRVLNSKNVILLDCVDPMPRVLKVFYHIDLKSKPPIGKVFIDCTNVITKAANSKEYKTDEIKLISYLLNGAVCMVYHKKADLIFRRQSLIIDSATCFAKCFTFIIDYLAKVSIQESNKVKVMYLSAMYFLEGVLQMDDEEGSRKIAKKIAGISDREANMLDILLDKVCREPGVKDPNPYENIKVFISALREVMHLDKKVITKDIIVEKWMMQFGPSTVFGLEYFPCFSAMMTDAYVGGYLNQQRTIEKVCGSDMVSYSKGVLNLITVIA